MGDLIDFMKSVRGSFYNAGFISCNDCPKKCKVRDFIFAPDANGRPIIIKRADAISIANDIEPTLYKFIAESRKFIDFYGLYFMWESDSDDECPLLRLSLPVEKDNVSNSDKNIEKSGKAPL